MQASDIKSPETKTTKPKRKATAEQTMQSAVREELNQFKTDIMNILESWKSEQREYYSKKFSTLESTLTDIKKSHGELEKSMEFLSTRYEEFVTNIDSINTKFKNYQQQIVSLENQIEELQRINRCNSIELRNVPVQNSETKETLSSLVINLAKVTGMDMSTNDIRDIYRIPGKSEKPGQRPIIVGFSSIIFKEKILKSTKSFNVQNKTSKLNASHLGFKNNASPIFVSEHLTSKANRLYFLARDLKASGICEYCWTANGKVYVRKTHGAQAIYIKNEESVSSLREGYKK